MVLITVPPHITQLFDSIEKSVIFVGKLLWYGIFFQVSITTYPMAFLTRSRPKRVWFLAISLNCRVARSKDQMNTQVKVSHMAICFGISAQYLSIRTEILYQSELRGDSSKVYLEFCFTLSQYDRFRPSKALLFGLSKKVSVDYFQCNLVMACYLRELTE